MDRFFKWSGFIIMNNDIKIGDIVFTKYYGGKVIMIVNKPDGNKEYTIELPCKLYERTTEIIDK